MAPKRAFTQAKQQALTKHDKSSATSFDARVVGLCAAANDSPYVFTTSSCSGRHLLWRGEGVKATQSFARGRVSHDRADAAYFLDHDANDQAPFRKAPLDAAFGCETAEVNSYHKQGVADGQVAPRLRVAAIGMVDGVVEALVHESLPILGIQWHPERPNPGAALDACVVDRLHDPASA